MSSLVIGSAGFCARLRLAWRPLPAVLLAGVMLAAAGPAAALNGGWSVVPTPHEHFAPQLTAVSCVSADWCAAVGYYQTPAVRPPASVLGSYTLAESWDGTRWSVLPSPSPGSTANQGAGSDLAGVSCVSARWCVAVGGYQTAGGDYKALIESWDGTRWSVLPSPSLGPQGGGLSGVSCVSSTACTAAGLVFTSNGARALVESWDGARWSVVPTPSPGPSDSLDGVSCVSSAACTAVGLRSVGDFDKTLIESWDGTRWSVVPSPNAGPPGSFDHLYGVSCASAAACTAVGSEQKGTTVKTLIESWNGTRWSLPPAPSPGSDASLDGVSCASPAACTAVGEHSDQQQGYQTLIESWNGARWSLVPSPNVLPPAGRNQLDGGVSCESASECTAVGRYYYAQSYRIRTLVEAQRPAA